MVDGCQIIVKFSEKRLTNIIDVNRTLGINSPGDTAVVVVEAEGSAAGFMERNGFRVNAQRVEFGREYSSSGETPLVALTLDSFDTEGFSPASATMTIRCGGEERKASLAFTSDELTGFAAYPKQGRQQNAAGSSFMLLRTNPKLTGNIKLVVGDDYQLYLDTFKVSSTSILNDRRYRHQKVSSDGNYPRDVKAVFSDVPKGELFNVHADAYDPHKTYYDLWQQIDNTYEYGAETNTDSLYPEDMRILAPLHIGKTVPEFFAVFRSDTIVNTDTYNDVEVNDVDAFRERVRDAEVIRIFDLRNHTSIGHYLNAYKDAVQPYSNNQVYLQFTEQDMPGSTLHGQDAWYGVSVDKGIFTKKIETTYFGSRILEGDNPQENFSKFVLDGFERNNILYPNILNLEFMFNDDEVEQFSMHNYFGLYLTENDFLELECVIQSRDGNERLDYYGTDGVGRHRNQLDLAVVEDGDYDDRLFFMTTRDKVADMKSIDDVDDFVKSYVCNAPGDNVCNVASTEIDFDDAQSFITVRFTEPIRYGEHFRFVFLGNSTYGDKENVVLEAVASNDGRLRSSRNNINPYVQTNTPEKAGMEEDNTKIYRLSFYTQDTEDPSKPAPLAEQLRRLAACVAKFDAFMHVGSVSDDTISFISTEVNALFQHITADIRDVHTPSLDDFTAEPVGKDTIRCFTYNNEIDLYEAEFRPAAYLDNHLPFAMNGFEILGNRLCSVTRFMQLDDYEGNSWYQLDEDIYQEIKNIRHPLANTVKGYFPLTRLDYGTGHLSTDPHLSADSFLTTRTLSTFVATSPFDVTRSMVSMPYRARLNNGYVNICSPVATSLAVMGINAVRDIDTRIDVDERVAMSSSTSMSIAEGESVPLNSALGIRRYTAYAVESGCIQHIPTGTGVVFMLTDDSLLYEYKNEVVRVPYTNDYIYAVKDTVVRLVGSGTDVFSTDTAVPAFRSANYYVDPTDPASRLSIPVVPLVNCRWRSNGTYADGVSDLDTDTLDGGYERNGFFVENKYNPSPAPNYIGVSADDIVAGMSVADFIRESGYAFPIRKCMSAGKDLLTAICYYNEYIQTLEFIYGGVKYTMKFTSPEYRDALKLSQYDNYEVMVVNDFRDDTPNEMFISTDEEFILVINHGYGIAGIDGTDGVIGVGPTIQGQGYNHFRARYAYELIDTAWIPADTYCLHKTGGDEGLGDMYAYAQLDLDLYDEGFFYTEGNAVDVPVMMYYDAQALAGGGGTYDMLEGQRFVSMTDVSTGDVSRVDHRNNNLFNKAYGEATADYKMRSSHVMRLAAEPADMTYAEKLDAFIGGFDTRNFTIYLIGGGSCRTIEMDDYYRPLEMQLSVTERVKFHNGYFIPRFNDVFSFDREDTLSERVGVDLLGCNTRVSGIEPITNYTCNKVMEDRAENRTNYFVEPRRRMFTSNWDNNLYRLYRDDSSHKTLAGYATGVADRTLFGSVCINLQYPELTIGKFDYDMGDISEAEVVADFNEHSEGRAAYSVRVNVTKVFYHKMMASDAFVGNWSGNISGTDTDAAVNNYINNTLHRFYNFESGLDLRMRRRYDINKAEKESPMVYDEPLDIEDYEDFTNYKNSYKVLNGDVYLEFELPEYGHHYYYPTIKIQKY